MKKVFASLSNPDANPVILQEKEDEMETIVECPYCHQPTKFGDTVMISGFVGCNNCYWTPKVGLKDVVMNLKENNYEEYIKGDFYKDGYKG